MVATEQGSLVNGASVLVTGGTGSFGRKFVEIVLAKYSPQRLIIFSRGEFQQHQMRQQFPDSPESPSRYFIGDIRDPERLHRAFQGVDIVVHAAALKQVPAAEYNPIEAVLTNVMGARNVINAALDCGVQRVIALSSDKACSPVNLYGATKLVMEKLMIQANSYRGATGTRFSCVRYGNVVGSRGSVIPIFREQSQSGILDITHPDMTRFWITLDAGVRFVLSSLGLMHGGEVFVPKLPSMKIVDVARTIMPKAKLRFVGIRSGEKLHELMVASEESRNCVDIGDRYCILPAHPWWSNGDWPDAKPVPEGWQYCSGTNSAWLTPQAMREMIDAG